MAKEKKQQRYHNGLAIDSDEEYFMLLYLEELMRAGLVRKVERAESFVLSLPLIHSYSQEVVMKTKTKIVEKEQILLDEHIYTPEFKVWWTEAGYSQLVDDIAIVDKTKRLSKPFISCGHRSILEIKPSFDKHNMTRLFKINQKWMWQKHTEVVNLIQPQKLMENTFTPREYLKTPTGKDRVIHWSVRTLEQYLETLKPTV